jgi:hypothetical protein
MTRADKVFDFIIDAAILLATLGVVALGCAHVPHSPCLVMP